MRLKFEQLEQRLALSGIGVDGWDCPELPEVHLQLLLDSFEGDRLIGAASARDCRATHTPNEWSDYSDAREVQSAVPAGDLNQDGFEDVYVTYVVQQHKQPDGQRGLYQIRYTHFGGMPLPNWAHDGNEGVLLSTLPNLAGSSWQSSSWTPPAGYEEFTLHDVDRTFPVPVNIGDIDGDGFEDQMRRSKRVLYQGTAAIDFGPDFRDSFLLPGAAVTCIDVHGDPCYPVDTPDPAHAGPLGDVNGDGYGDFYVLRHAATGGGPWIDVFAGRDFGRDLPADIDRNGTVDFADFLVLAYNYGNENATRSEGDLDGDGLVAFSDFIVLRDTFGQSKGDVPLASG